MTWTRHASDGDHRVCVDLRMPEEVGREQMIEALDHVLLGMIAAPYPTVVALHAIRSVIAQLPGEGDSE